MALASHEGRSTSRCKRKEEAQGTVQLQWTMTAALPHFKGRQWKRKWVCAKLKQGLTSKKKKDLLLSGTGCCTRLYNLPLLRPFGTGCTMSDGHNSFQSYFQMLSISPSDSQESARPVCAFQTPRQLTPLPCPRLRLLRWERLNKQQWKWTGTQSRSPEFPWAKHRYWLIWFKANREIAHISFDLCPCLNSIKPIRIFFFLAVFYTR